MRVELSEDYVKGFNDGISADKHYPQTLRIMGYSLNEIVNLIIKNEETKMTTKQIMTRAEAIAMLRNHMPLSDSSERTIDFYVKAGMLELKEEEEEKPVFELKYPSGVHAYKIWANGRVEGFNEGIVIINRIPELIAKFVDCQIKAK